MQSLTTYIYNINPTLQRQNYQFYVIQFLEQKIPVPALAQGNECAGLGPEKGGGPSSKNRSLYYIWSGPVPQQQITILHMPGHARLAALVHLLRGCVRRLGSGFEARESEPALPPADARQTAKSRLKSSTDQVSNFPFFSNLESRCLNFSIFAQCLTISLINHQGFKLIILHELCILLEFLSFYNYHYK